MAKLSARGRTEVVRVSKATHEPRDYEGKVSELTDWEKRTRALMSDGTVLEKLQVRFRSDGRTHDYGWKRAAKLKAGKYATDFLAFYRDRGWDVDADRTGERYSRDRAGRLLNPAQ